MTAKEIVQRKFPYARAYKWGGPDPWVVYLEDGTGRGAGYGRATAAQAWEAARKELRLRRAPSTRLSKEK